MAAKRQQSDDIAARPLLVQRLKLVGGVALLGLLSACASQGPNLQGGSGYEPSSYAPPGPPSDPWGPYIRSASKRFNVPQAWIRQVMHVESGGHEYMNGHLTESGAGAEGLMQLEPATFRELSAEYNLGSDPFNPYANIMAGTAYIHEMYEIYGSPGFLAAYNAGPGRLNNYLFAHEPLPNETKNYLAMIAPHIEGIYPGSAGANDFGTPSSRIGGRVMLADAAVPASSPETASLNDQSLRSHAMPMPDRSGAMAKMPASRMPIQRLPVSTAPVMAIAFNTTSPASENIGQKPVSALPNASLPPPAPTVQVAYLTPPAPVSAPMPSWARDARKTRPLPVQHFALVPMAEASVPSPRLDTSLNSGSGWAVQVGAYQSSSDAKAALGIAELSAVRQLIKGRPIVNMVSTAHGLFYRARFVGLPHNAAIAACHQLSHGSTGCMVISPDAEG